jgi:hypothetical protein
MTRENGQESFSEARRKEVFLALVNAQDQALDVSESRRVVVQQFGLSENQIRQIEREGLDQQWPPL